MVRDSIYRRMQEAFPSVLKPLSSLFITGMSNVHALKVHLHRLSAAFLDAEAPAGND
jgi:hypothetical protein